MKIAYLYNDKIEYQQKKYSFQQYLWMKEVDLFVVEEKNEDLKQWCFDYSVPFISDDLKKCDDFIEYGTVKNCYQFSILTKLNYLKNSLQILIEEEMYEVYLQDIENVYFKEQQYLSPYYLQKIKSYHEKRQLCRKYSQKLSRFKKPIATIKSELKRECKYYENIQSCIDWLIHFHYLDDEQYVYSYLMAHENLSKKMCYYQLIQKGIKDSLIIDNELYLAKNDEELLHKLLPKLIKKYEKDSDFIKLQKIKSYCYQKQFEIDQVLELYEQYKDSNQQAIYYQLKKILKRQNAKKKLTIREIKHKLYTKGFSLDEISTIDWEEYDYEY